MQKHIQIKKKLVMTENAEKKHKRKKHTDNQSLTKNRKKHSYKYFVTNTPEQLRQLYACFVLLYVYAYSYVRFKNLTRACAIIV